MNGKRKLKITPNHCHPVHFELAIFAPIREETSEVRTVGAPNNNLDFPRLVRRDLRGAKEKMRVAFTLVELMVAMAITLLLMAGLAKSFSVIGKSIKESRSQLSLSSNVRNLGFRLRSDLGARTVQARPPISSTTGKGYFMYYEGPLTEHTFGLYGASPERTLADGETVVYPFEPRDSASANPLYDSPDVGPTYRRHGRIGDFDDYIAFTAEAPDNQWFTGKVPAYLVQDGLTGAAAMEPRVIRSKYAEIIIWAAPVWQVDPTNNALRVADNPSAMPMYRDDNLDLVPDQIVLHQRTLLIRPDLNVRRTIPGVPPFESMVLRPWNNNAAPDLVPTPLERIYPIGNATPANWSPTSTTSGPTQNQLLMREPWLVGMAPLHHFFDLSLRRIFHSDTGVPTNFVAANSLEDLVQPHNRFAHVRYPGTYFGMGNNATSMPLLALGWNDAIIRWLGTIDPRAETPTATPPAWFPNSFPSPRTWTPNGSGPNDGCGIFNGWLLPHFELGDPSDRAIDPSETPGQWQRGYLNVVDRRWDRTGEDVLSTNVLSFDIRGFDSTAPVFITSGPDGRPGRSGVDDDGAPDPLSLGIPAIDATRSNNFGGEIQPVTELGSDGSDDMLIGVNDLGIYSLMYERIMSPSDLNSFPHPSAGTYAAQANGQAIASRGDFVDLMYPYLAGSPLRNATSSIPAPPAPPSSAWPPLYVNYTRYMTSDLSLFPLQRPYPQPLLTPTTATYINSMKQSGKLAHTAGGTLLYFQPTYDTWTDGYEHDGFDQSQTADGTVVNNLFLGNRWILNNVVGALRAPRLLDTVNPDRQKFQIDTGRLDPTNPETSPPFPIDLPAISITIRIHDPSTEEMTQFTVIENLQ